MPEPVSRRSFVLGTAGAVLSATSLRGRPQALSAQTVADRIRAQFGVPWRLTTNDGFKAGSPATIVTGVAVTLAPTIDVLRRAAAARQNLVVALGPTFYTPNDVPGARANDPVYTTKRDLISQQHLVIWRFDDHWSRGEGPASPSVALARALGWDSMDVPGRTAVYRIPQIGLGALASAVRARLSARGGVRVVGRPSLTVRTVVVTAGTTGMSRTLVELPGADVVLAGEPREWEVVPYVHDTMTAGTPKGLIAVGRLVSYSPGLQAFTTWLRTVVTEVPVAALAIDDPHWNPAS